jgi:2-dehydro-3-deoxygluconokinase
VDVTHVLDVGEPLHEILQDQPGSGRAGFGGDALNVAVYLAREAPSLRVCLGSGVGDDPATALMMEACRAEGIDLTCLRYVPGTRTGHYTVVVDASGERSFRYRRRDSPFRGLFDTDEHPLPDPAGVGLLWFSGIGMAVLHEAGRRRLFDYARAVRSAAGTVAYDPNHRPALWGSSAEARRWTGRIARSVADIVLASADDGRQLLDADSPREAAEAFRSLGAKEVVVTDGSGPCIVMHGSGVTEVRAARVTDVADTTAAGDAFDAAYIAARLRGEGPERSAEAGHRLAAVVVGHRGALTPRRD